MANKKQKTMEFWPLNKLIPYARNARTHSQEQIEKICASIAEFGFNSPILVDGENGIIAGHGRFMAAKKLGLKEVPVVVLTHMTDAQKRAYILADNKIAELAGWDKDLLKDEIADLKKLGADLDSVGFSDVEIAGLENELFGEDFFQPKKVNTNKVDRFFKDKEFKTDPDEIPEQVPATTKLGDIYQLGAHRLMCGDSTSIDAVERLMAGEKAELCFTSPPYADQREYNGGKELSTEHLATFIRTSRDKVNYFAVNLGYSRKNGEVNQYWNDYIKEARDCGLKLLSWNVWNKGECGSIGNQTAMFGVSHEWIFVFGSEAKDLNRTVANKSAGELANHNWNRQKDGSIKKQKDRIVGDFSQMKTVYDCVPQKERDDIDHPARFPIRFPEGYIEAMTDINHSVYEPFCGSGSTLMACENSGRRCYAMELDPHYCDVIVARWEKFTGKKAEKIE